jgi:hypothetical protein
MDGTRPRACCSGVAAHRRGPHLHAIEPPRRGLCPPLIFARCARGAGAVRARIGWARNPRKGTAMSTITASAQAASAAEARRPTVAQRLAGYADRSLRGRREIVTIAGAGGSVLVVDRLAADGRDARLVAHLAADEPAVNARLVSRLYLEDHARRGRCRLVEATDLRGAPTSPDEPATAEMPSIAEGSRYVIALVDLQGKAQLCWTTRQADATLEVVTLRDVVGELESYEPPITLTRQAIAEHRGLRGASVCRLADELTRLQRSDLMLNRRLRETVLAHIQAGEATLSEIALRCGRVKRDRRGVVSGETTWLRRRIGLASEQGQSRPTPWIHSDTLALIAREGLGVAPREVEL